MKRRFGNLLMVTGLCVSLAANSVIAFASESESNIIATHSTQEQIQPRVNWKGLAYLAKEQWCNVTSSNNIFDDKPTVTNDASNPADICVRIINAAGAQVGEIKLVMVGESVTMDKIPWNSGTYTLQAYTSTAGNYMISID